MQIADIVRPSMTRREARHALKKAGWTFVGGGSFATVYQSPDGKVVAKVTKPDRGQDALFRIAQANPDNPHFPHFAGRLALKTPSGRTRGYVYEVERLTKFRGWSSYEQAQDRSARLPTYVAAHRIIEDAIRESRERPSRNWLSDDFGLANAMHRRDTFVFTDPLYAEEDLSRVYRGRSGSNPDISGYGQEPTD